MLDRSKPFGQIYPPHRGACYEQGGRYFGAQGQHLAELDPEVVEVDEDAPAVSAQVAARKKPGPKPKMPIEPDAPAAPAVSAQVAARKKPGPKPKMPIEPDAPAAPAVSAQVAAQLGDDA